MLGDLFAFLKFLTDPETRGTVNAISNALSSSGKEWKKQIKTVSATFSSNDQMSIIAFMNTLLRDLKQIDMSPREIDKFKTVFNELIQNAFEHGCKEINKCKVIVRCTYSPWFIRLEVMDKGKGFDFNEAIKSASESHGLFVVKKLSYRLMANKKGNSIIAFILDDELKIHSSVELYEGHEILTVKVTSRGEWNYFVKSWEPLHRVVKQAPQKLVIIDGGIMRFGTVDSRDFKEEVVLEYKELLGRSFALIIDYITDDTYNFSALAGDNLKIFVIHGEEEEDKERTLEGARSWLIERVSKRGSRR